MSLSKSLTYLCTSLFIAGHSAFAFVDEITLEDDATGGECTAVGSWNPATKTCVLTQNLDGNNVVFENDDITLDCDGFFIKGEQTAEFGGATEVGVSLGSGPPTGVTVMNCHILNFCQAIHFDDSEHNRVLHNTIESIFQDGSCDGGTSDQVHIDDDYDVIMGNEFLNNVGGDGLALNFSDRDGTDTRVINNKFFNQDNTNIINVRCDDGATGDGTVIKRNLIHDEGLSNDGIEVSDQDCTNFSIVSNRIHQQGTQDCIEIRGSDHEVMYNLCQFTADEALEVETTNSWYEGNTLVHSTVEEFDDATCEALDEDDNATIEIECGSVGNTFVNNTIVNDFCGSGILIESTGCAVDQDFNVIEENRIYKSAFNGIFIRNPDATGNEIRNNKIYQNGLDGVRNDGTDTVIKDNAIRSNGEWGIDDNGTGTIISGNKGKGGALGVCSGAGC